ncbi:MAG: hypothetical protein QXJ64_03515 [Thermosphaera sp.]
MRLWVILVSLLIFSFTMTIITAFFDKYLLNTMKGIIASIETADLNAREIKLLPTTRNRIVELVVYSSGDYQQVVYEATVDYEDFMVIYDPSENSYIMLKFNDYSGREHKVIIENKTYSNNYVYQTYYEIQYFVNNELYWSTRTYCAPITIRYENRSLDVIACTTYGLARDLNINKQTITTIPSNLNVIVKYQGIYGAVTVKVHSGVVATLSGKNLYFLPNDGSDGKSVVDVRIFYIEPGQYRIKIVKDKYVTRDFYTFITQYLPITGAIIAMFLAGILLYSYRR